MGLMIAIDFDGTITSYKKFQGKGVFDPPLPNARAAIHSLKQQGHTIIINTTRLEIHQVKEYLEKHDIPFDYINFNPVNVERMLSPCKVIADVYIDDRAIEFRGNWEETLGKVNRFKPWYK